MYILVLCSVEWRLYCPLSAYESGLGMSRCTCLPTDSQSNLDALLWLTCWKWHWKLWYVTIRYHWLLSWQDPRTGPMYDYLSTSCLPWEWNLWTTHTLYCKTGNLLPFTHLFCSIRFNLWHQQWWCISNQKHFQSLVLWLKCATKNLKNV